MPRFSLLLLLLLLAGCRDVDGPDVEAASDPGRAVPEEASGPAGDAEGEADEPVALFLGDSITAGYGLEDEADAFPGQLDALAEAEGVPLRVVAAGQSGDTSAGGLRRLEWLLRRYTPDVLVIELGGNDGLRGQSLEALRENLLAAIDAARAANPDIDVIVAAVPLPPNYGDYGRNFLDVFPAVAEEARVSLIELLPEGLGEAQDVLQSDGIHPTAEGQRLIAERLWPAVRTAAAASGP